MNTLSLFSSRFRAILAVITTTAVILLYTTNTAAAEPAKTDAAQSTVATVVAKAKTDYKDAFLQLVLDKAQKYTAAGERAAEKAVDTVSTEAPQVMTEFITWRAWMHGVKALLPLIGAFVGVGLYLWQWPKWELDYHGHRVRGTAQNIIASYVGIVVAVIGTIILCVSGVSHLLSFIQVLVAPRIYVIEQVIHLVK